MEPACRARERTWCCRRLSRTRDLEIPAHLRRLAGRPVYQALNPTSLAAHPGTLRVIHRINSLPSPDPYLADLVIKAPAPEATAK
jgi:hypothetical protein